MNCPTLHTSLTCAILLASCTSTDSEQENTETRQVVLEEILRLGDEAAGDTILFGSISEIAVNSQGDILVRAEHYPTMIYAFGRDGTYLNQIGGPGQGPGEYEYGISGPVIGKADSVYLWESRPNQISIYDPTDFSYVRSVEVKEEGMKQIYPLVGAVEDGWIMETGLPDFLAGEDGSMTVNDNPQRELIKVNLDGSYNTDPIGILPAGEFIRSVYDGGFGMIAVPFGRSSTTTVGPDDRLYYGWSESIEITAVSADGSDSEVISYKHIPVAITAAEMAEAKEEEDPAWRQSLTEYGHYETKPAFQTFTVDEAGHVWVKLSNLEQATVAEWLILNQDSQLVGKVELPVSVSLYRIQDGHAYGIEQGGDMGPMVVVYQIMD